MAASLNGELDGDSLRKTKRSKRGKGRKERMRSKIEKLTRENEQHQQKAQELASKNLTLKRLVYLTIYLGAGYVVLKLPDT